MRRHPPGVPLTKMIKSERPFKLYASKENFKKIKFLFYGRSGTGKTVLSSSASAVPDLGPVLGVDMDGGMLAATANGYTDIDLTKVDSFTASEDSYMQVHKYLVGPDNEYSTAILDSLTEMQQLVVTECLRESGKKQPDWPVWGLVTGKMRAAVRRIRDLPIHVIATALDRQVKDEQTGMMVCQPSLNGKMAEEIPGFFDVVARLAIKKNKEGKLVRVAYFEGDGTFVAKDRTNSLGRVMEDPTIEKMWDLIRKKHPLKA